MKHSEVVEDILAAIEPDAVELLERWQDEAPRGRRRCTLKRRKGSKWTIALDWCGGDEWRVVERVGDDMHEAIYAALRAWVKAEGGTL